MYDCSLWSSSSSSRDQSWYTSGFSWNNHHCATTGKSGGIEIVADKPVTGPSTAGWIEKSTSSWGCGCTWHTCKCDVEIKFFFLVLYCVLNDRHTCTDIFSEIVGRSLLRQVFYILYEVLRATVLSSFLPISAQPRLLLPRPWTCSLTIWESFCSGWGPWTCYRCPSAE